MLLSYEPKLAEKDASHHKGEFGNPICLDGIQFIPVRINLPDGMDQVIHIGLCTQ